MDNHYDEESKLRDCRQALADAGYPTRLIDSAMKLVGVPPSKKMMRTLLKARKICVTATEAIEYARRGGNSDTADSTSGRRHRVRLAVSVAVLVAVAVLIGQLAQSMPGLQMEEASLPDGWSINNKEHTEVSAYDSASNKWTYWSDKFNRNISTAQWKYDTICRKPIILDCNTNGSTTRQSNADDHASTEMMLLIPINYKQRLNEFIKKQ